MALRVSDEIFTTQLRATLIPGTNVTFNTTNPKQTIINASGGGGGGAVLDLHAPIAVDDLLVLNSTLDAPRNKKLTSTNTALVGVNISGTQVQIVPGPLATYYNPSTIYPVQQSDLGLWNSLLAVGTNSAGNLYRTDTLINADLFFLDIDNSVVSTGTDLKQTRMLSAVTPPVYLTASGPTTTKSSQSSLSNNITNLNWLTFQTNSNLSTANFEGFNWTHDFTIALAITTSSQLQLNNSPIFSFGGTSTIYSMSLDFDENLQNCIKFQHADAHNIPIPNNTNAIILIRCTATNAFVTQIDACVNGICVYTGFVDTSMTLKSLGIGGDCTIGPAAALNVAYFGAFARALSDEECAKVTTAISLMRNMPITNSFNAIPHVTYNSFSSGVSTVNPQETPRPSNYTLTATFPPTKANTPVTYNWKFYTNAQQFLSSGALTGLKLSGYDGYSLVSLFAVPVLPLAINIVNVAKFNFTLGDSIAIQLVGDVGSFNFRLAYTPLVGPTIYSANTTPFSAQNNNECAISLIVKRTNVWFSAYDYSTNTGTQTSLSVPIVGEVGTVLFGRDSSSPTHNVTYHLGDIMLFPYIKRDIQQQIDLFKTTYSLPLAINLSTAL